MSGVSRKREIDVIDGTPEKRLFWSIISDYDLRTGICELVDNAIDLWMTQGRRTTLKISVTLDVERQLISIVDDAGGVKKEDLRMLIAPGGSRNDPSAEVIGIFGVGSKRAGVALGEQVIIRTRYRKSQTYQLDITKEWLETPYWDLASYEIPNISPGTTQVDISHLRKPFTINEVKELQAHLGETYSWFLNEGCSIELNSVTITPKAFDTWAYPPAYPPQTVSVPMELEGAGSVSVSMTAGLILDRNPDEENYGVYFYCNHRLIVKELRSREVGYFVTSEAGVPHPDASLCRVIVHLQGPAQAMPWNSSKSGINFAHPVFQNMRPMLIQLVSHFSSLSRRLKNDWGKNVFRHETGSVSVIDPADIGANRRLILPQLPRVNKPKIEKLKTANKALIRNEPWTLGLVEAMGAVEIITRQKLDTRNRIALILLDSNFEIALKEFIVHRPKLFPMPRYGDEVIQKLFKNRTNVIREVSEKIKIPAELLDRARHYYMMRNKLIHERATLGVTDADIENYKETIEKILKILFGVKFSSY